MKYIISFILSLVCFTNVMAKSYIYSEIVSDKWINDDIHIVGGGAGMLVIEDNWSFILLGCKANDLTSYIFSISVETDSSEYFKDGSYFLIKTCDGAIIKVKSDSAKSEISSSSKYVYDNRIRGQLSQSDIEHIKSGIYKIRIECDNTYGKIDKCYDYKYLPNLSVQLGETIYKLYQDINQRLSAVTKKPSLEDGF